MICISKSDITIFSELFTLLASWLRTILWNQTDTDVIISLSLATYMTFSLISLNLSFLIYKMRIIKITTAQSCYMD